MFKNILPLTYSIKLPVLMNGEIDTRQMNKELKAWKQAFKLLQSQKDEILKCKYTQKTSTVIGNESNKQFRLKSNQPLVMPLCHFAGKNVWILKPTGLNRGKGIHVVDSIKEMKKLIRQTCSETKMQTNKMI